MTSPSIPDLLTMTAAGLTALGDAPLWVALAIALPPALTATARGINEILTGISAFRTASMHRRQTDRLLDEITDPNAGLGHLERVQTNAPPATGVAITDPPPATSITAPPAAPP
ncbi:hypothetical protein [Streptomyces justiciae]|uniref:hypothetical protein n=1 Tax=Streptomyces justiciae TaxID=2780140 RepID=UPI00187E311A|nr:hypothetical protein [Streptomyces justiciae]MBE8477487.1 hypothetical protein [Streptomyces justiciae]